MHNIIDEKFWLAIAFFAFVVLILKYVWPILSLKISEQSKQIAKDLLDAKNMKEEAEKLLAESKANYEKSLESSKKLVSDAEIEAKKLVEEAKKDLEADSKRKIEALNNRIKNEEAKVVRELKEKIVVEAFKNIEETLQSSKNNQNVVKNSLDDISKMVH